MTRLSVKTYLALLWGISVLFSMSASIPETSSINSSAEPNTTTTQQLSTNIVQNETETQPPTWHPAHGPASVETTVSPAVETAETSVSATDQVVITVDATTSSSGPGLLHTSAAVTTAAGEAQPPQSTTISETAKPTEAQSPTTSADVTLLATTSGTTSAASLAPAAPSSPQPASTTEPEVASEISRTTSPANSTQAPVFTLSGPSASATTTGTEGPTSEAAPVFDSTSIPATKSETSSTEPVSVTRTRSSTSEFTVTAESSSTAEPPTASFSTDSTVSTTAAVSILIPRVPKRLPIPTTKPTPMTTMVSKNPSSTEVQPCSTRGIAKHCLIAIASLAGLATIFMVSTIILCTKLSTRKYKYKVKKPQPATEMMCISALLPERTHTYTRQRNPVTNGVLVIHNSGDSDDDGGDNLTLSSFLPENDRVV